MDSGPFPSLQECEGEHLLSVCFEESSGEVPNGPVVARDEQPAEVREFRCDERGEERSALDTVKSESVEVRQVERDGVREWGWTNAGRARSED